MTTASQKIADAFSLLAEAAREVALSMGAQAPQTATEDDTPPTKADPKPKAPKAKKEEAVPGAEAAEALAALRAVYSAFLKSRGESAVAVLDGFGVQKLSGLHPDKYPEFHAAMAAFDASALDDLKKSAAALRASKPAAFDKLIKTHGLPSKAAPEDYAAMKADFESAMGDADADDEGL